MVNAEDYLLACQRYIELNPVRAGMVNDPGQYRWSSYRHNGLQMGDSRLTAHTLYLGLGSTAETRGAAYRALFRPQLDQAAAETIREALSLGMPPGQGRFAETVCAQLGIRRNTGVRGRPAKKKRQCPWCCPASQISDFKESENDPFRALIGQRLLVDDEQRTQGYFGGMRLNFLSLKFQQPVKGAITMDDLMCRGLAIGTIGVALSFFSLPASADWQTPCSCEHLKSIMKTIKADEYAKQRYSEKVQEYEKKDPTPIVLVVQADDYTYFATKGLPNELKKQFGYGDTIGISRDAKSDRADQGKMDQYKKSAICRDDYESAVAHEKYHDLAGLKIKKMTPDDAKKADQARSLAKEEVAAYEAGLKVLRAARDRLKAGCDWVCDSARKGAGGKSYKDHTICERSCPGTLASNMRVSFRCFNAKNLK